jgi:hypothetical protein
MCINRGTLKEKQIDKEIAKKGQRHRERKGETQHLLSTRLMLEAL